MCVNLSIDFSILINKLHSILFYFNFCRFTTLSSIPSEFFVKFTSHKGIFTLSFLRKIFLKILLGLFYCKKHFLVSILDVFLSARLKFLNLFHSVFFFSGNSLWKILVNQRGCSGLVDAVGWKAQWELFDQRKQYHAHPIKPETSITATNNVVLVSVAHCHKHVPFYFCFLYLFWPVVGSAFLVFLFDLGLAYALFNKLQLLPRKRICCLKHWNWRNF